MSRAGCQAESHAWQASWRIATEDLLDPLVLAGMVGELGSLLVGQEVGDVVQLDTPRFLIRFARPPFPRLHIGLHPHLSTCHLVSGLKAPSTTTDLAVSLSRRLSGRVVTGMKQPVGDRLLEIRFDSGDCLVAELMGKASNLLLLDSDRTILLFARDHRGTFRHPAQGRPYQAPPPPLLGPGRRPDRDLFNAARREAGRGLAAAILRAFPGCSPPLAREAEFLAGRGEDPWACFLALLERAWEKPPEPVLHLPCAPDRLDEATPLTSRNLFTYVFRLEHAGDLHVQTMASLDEAERSATARRVSYMRFSALNRSLGGLIGRELRRSSTLSSALKAELEEAVRSAAEDRKRGELILAGMSEAERIGSTVIVPDSYDPGRARIEIPIDGRFDLKQNAERYFSAARKADRTRGIIPGRLAGVDRRMALLVSAEEELERARSIEGLDQLEKRLQEAGLIRAFRKTQREDLGRKPEFLEVREYLSADKFTILVGKTGAENDHLTFKVASPHDLWLHAAGFHGAHVIVRNPRRLASLPSGTIEQAAAIAAWFSKGRSETALDVHYTWRRHVRKGRGMSPGMVMLKRHRTVRVRPGLPRRKEA